MPSRLEEDLHRWSHSRLDIHLSNVLPLFLQQGSQKICCQLDVDNDLLLFHGHVSDSDVEAHNLLHLELDGGLDLINFLLHIFLTGKKGGELSGLGKTRTKKTGDLLNHVVRSHEEIVLLGKLLNKLLVLVQLLEVINTHVLNTNTIGLFAMDGISKHAALDIGAGDGRKAEGTGETLVPLGIVVLQGDLDLNGLSEVTLLSLKFSTVLGDGFTGGEGKNVIDRLLQERGVKFIRHDEMCWLLPSDEGRDTKVSLLAKK
jgi:hypothetical protein